MIDRSLENTIGMRIVRTDEIEFAYMTPKFEPLSRQLFFVLNS